MFAAKMIELDEKLRHLHERPICPADLLPRLRAESVDGSLHPLRPRHPYTGIEEKPAALELRAGGTAQNAAPELPGFSVLRRLLPADGRVSS